MGSAVKRKGKRSYFIFGAIDRVMDTCFTVFIRMELTRSNDQILGGNQILGRLGHWGKR